MSLKEPTPNELIPVLIKKFSEYSNKIKDRIKIDEIFSEFNLNAHNEFNKFIKMSQNRYKSVKSGNTLENVIFKQKPFYNMLSNMILADQFYNTNEIEKENRKLFKKSSKKENKEITEIRNKILEKIKDYSKSELHNRERLEKKVLAKREAEKLKEEAMKISRLNYNYEPKLFEKKTNINSNNLPIEETEPKEENIEETLKEKKEFFENLMKKDKEEINENILDYKEYLKDVENKHKEGDPLKLNNIKDNYGHKFSFLTENVKLISYREEQNNDKKIKKVEEPKIDIRKLMKYTRRGKSAFAKLNKKLKNINKNINNNKNIKTKSIFKNNSPSQTFYYSKYQESKLPINNDISLQSTTMGLTTRTGFIDYKNTIKTVKNEAEKVRFLDENFDKKRDTMESFFKQSELPQINNYEDMLKLTKNSFYKQNQNINENNNNNISQIQDYKKYKFNDRSYPKRREIKSGFERALKNKKKEWIKEDREYEIMKKKEEEYKKLTRDYLKDIQNRPRIPNYFVDGYSKKDQTNDNIKKFNKGLGGNYYSKKNIEKKANEYTKRLEKIKREKEYIENEKLEEIEKMKKQENFLEDQIVEKIRKNLNDDDDFEDIEFNFEVNGEKIKSKTLIDPYQEYLDFFKMQKEKENVNEIVIIKDKNKFKHLQSKKIEPKD